MKRKILVAAALATLAFCGSALANHEEDARPAERSRVSRGARQTATSDDHRARHAEDVYKYGHRGIEFEGSE